jgi:hypothetical protein
MQAPALPPLPPAKPKGPRSVGKELALLVNRGLAVCFVAAPFDR